MSTDSGIPDFRSSGGLQSTIPIEEILSAPYFYQHPEGFYKVYRKYFLLDAKPNEGHYILAELENKGFLSCIATQNIDGLHTQAGSKNVYELHGTIMKNFCLNCKEHYDMSCILNYPEIVPKCSKCGGTIKPDIVLYGEDIKYYEQTYSEFCKSDFVIILGSSLKVYPVAGFAKIKPHQRLIIVNYTETPFDSQASTIIRSNITEALRSIKNELLGN